MMVEIPDIKENIRLPIEIPVYPYLLDHRLEGKAVLPAVEAMQILADSVKKYRHDVDFNIILNASFDRFLYIRQDDEVIKAFNEIKVFSDGSICSTLLTKHKSSNTGITRTKNHVCVWFYDLRFKVCDLRFTIYDLRLKKKMLNHTSIAALKSAILNLKSIDINPEKLYTEFVPFGASYHNVCSLSICENGAVADIFSPVCKTIPGPLGSPFPLDAAFHAACAWGQRYAGITAFPVGFKSRQIFYPVNAQTYYTAAIMPVSISNFVLMFDIFIYDRSGVLCEAISNVKMKDVSGRIGRVEGL